MINDHHLIPGSVILQASDPLLTSACGKPWKTDAAILRLPKRGQAHWTDQRVPVQFFRHIPDVDPFSEMFPRENQQDAEHECQKRLERITAAAELLFATQHRLFLFMLVVVGRNFRLIRWDRAGVIVTPLTDYYDNPAVLCDFLRRLSFLDDTSLGFDPSATRLLARDADFLRMDTAATPNPCDIDHAEGTREEGEIKGAHVFRYVRSLFRGSLTSDWPRYRLQVPDGDKVRDYLVGKPIVQRSGVTGRGTRGYVALDCETGCFVWLKDAWRASVLIAVREGDVLRELNEAGIENVPTLVCHGDINDHATVTDIWWERKHPASSTPQPSPSRPESSTCTPDSSTNRKRKRGGRNHNEDAHSQPRKRRSSPSEIAGPGYRGPPQRHTHYRIVVQEVAMSLRNIQSGKQLSSIVLDCLHGEHCFITRMPCSYFLAWQRTIRRALTR